jgi:hypothetical protein
MQELSDIDGTPVLVEFSTGPGLKQVALTPTQTIQRSEEVLSEAMTIIRSLAERVREAAHSVAEPACVEVSFGIKFDMQAGAIIAKTGLESSLNVKIVWNSDQRP